MPYVSIHTLKIILSGILLHCAHKRGLSLWDTIRQSLYKRALQTLKKKLI